MKIANYPSFEGKRITQHFEDSDKPIIVSAESINLLNRKSNSGKGAGGYNCV